MPLNDYGFGPFGWLNDRYGVSWQLNLARRGRKARTHPTLRPGRSPRGDREAGCDHLGVAESRLTPGPSAPNCASLADMGTLNCCAMTAPDFYIRDRRA